MAGESMAGAEQAPLLLVDPSGKFLVLPGIPD
jgi:hypothetical protein